jgi:hypothetical protein
MRHDIQIQIFEDNNLTGRIFVTVSKWSEPKSVNRRKT